MEQFLACRVTSRYNHRFSDKTSIPRTKASLEILEPHILQHKHNSYYKPVQSIITAQNSVKHYTRHKFKVQSLKQRKENTMATTRRKKYTKLAQARYHSSGSLPVEDGSHSLDQPGGKEQGQDRLAIWSSKLIPEKGFNSKAEYSNTQQDLIVNGYT